MVSDGPANGDAGGERRPQLTGRWAQLAAVFGTKSIVWIRQTLLAVFLPALVMLIIVIIQKQIGGIGKFCSVIPRKAAGLKGLAFCWLAHWSYVHFMGNMMGWIGMVPGLMAYNGKCFLIATTFIQVMSALLTWIVGRTALHAGASGLLCGYFAFLMSAAFWIRPIRLKFLLVMAITGFLYFSTFVATVLSRRSEVSYELHVSGFLSGGIFAWLYFRVHKSLEPPSEDQASLLTRAGIREFFRFSSRRPERPQSQSGTTVGHKSNLDSMIPFDSSTSTSIVTIQPQAAAAVGQFFPTDSGMYDMEGSMAYSDNVSARGGLSNNGGADDDDNVDIGHEFAPPRGAIIEVRDFGSNSMLSPTEKLAARQYRETDDLDHQDRHQLMESETENGGNSFSAFRESDKSTLVPTAVVGQQALGNSMANTRILSNLPQPPNASTTGTTLKFELPADVDSSPTTEAFAQQRPNPWTLGKKSTSRNGGSRPTAENKHPASRGLKDDDDDAEGEGPHNFRKKSAGGGALYVHDGVGRGGSRGGDDDQSSVSSIIHQNSENLLYMNRNPQPPALSSLPLSHRTMGTAGMMGSIGFGTGIGESVDLEAVLPQERLGGFMGAGGESHKFDEPGVARMSEKSTSFYRAEPDWAGGLVEDSSVGEHREDAHQIGLTGETAGFENDGDGNDYDLDDDDDDDDDDDTGVGVRNGGSSAEVSVEKIMGAGGGQHFGEWHDRASGLHHGGEPYEGVEQDHVEDEFGYLGKDAFDVQLEEDGRLRGGGRDKVQEDLDRRRRRRRG